MATSEVTITPTGLRNIAKVLTIYIGDDGAAHLPSSIVTQVMIHLHGAADLLDHGKRGGVGGG
ncbi:hypothetical protein H8B02_18490 [Bradyrhizobium sp. Pear77]|uniref:hypothetical protein n=1 Tax=Bradyrhizobium altum TaxID=1571202 RepID=UPI001E47A063|nr:hypothetical protein [Bradyrhizobium altum]MCC8955350.1 hypothetical protein [Bradyrhizobium altum]